nr:hypothetical protein [Nocardia cyriacigeorgica]
MARTDFRLVAVSSANRDTTGQVTVRVDLVGDQRDDRQMGSAVTRLSLEPAVTRVGWRIAGMADVHA